MNAGAATPPARGPLAGVRVLDLSAYVAGPYACSLLADLGADVIKIEPPHGDQLRHYPSSLEHESRGFLGLNRSKRGIVLDLKVPEAQAVLARLAASADILIHNFRPGVPERLGLGFDRLQRSNPRLIYCALTGYGPEGPLRDRAGYDQVLQSFTGLCVFQGTPDEPQIVRGSVVDYYAASLMAYAVTAALYRREQTGRGESVDVSLLGSALAMQSGRFIWAESEGRDVERDLRSGGVTGIHPTRDGMLYLSVNTSHFWRALCEVLGLPALADDPAYDTIRKRALHADALVAKIRVALRQRTALEWEQLCGDRVPCCAVRAIEDMFDHPQVDAEGLMATFEHAAVGRYRGLAHPVRFAGTPCESPTAAPMLGQHTRAVLLEHGFTEDDVRQLCACGAIPEDGHGAD